MVLHLLEGLERRKSRVLVVQANDETQDAILVQVIDKTATVEPGPAILGCVGLYGTDLPPAPATFLHADSIGLWIGILSSVSVDQLFVQVVAAALSNDRDWRMDFDALRVRSWLACRSMPMSPDNSAHRAITCVVERCRTTGENINAQGFRPWCWRTSRPVKQ
jgi:hypothetical protein